MSAAGNIAAVIDELVRQFGPGMSNGVAAILLHPDLPDHFTRKEWADWTFRPAESAFEWAHDRGLICPWKLSSKWCFTELGKAVSERMRAASAIEARRAAAENTDAVEDESATAESGDAQ